MFSKLEIFSYIFSALFFNSYYKSDIISDYSELFTVKCFLLYYNSEIYELYSKISSSFNFIY